MRPDLLAFYGTLRDPALRRRLHVEELLAERGPCRIPGVLYDLGAYPALMSSGMGVVHGDLFAVRDPKALRILDAYEGCDPGDDDASVYVRRAVVLLEPRTTAWAYVFNRPQQGSQIISGNWRART